MGLAITTTGAEIKIGNGASPEIFTRIPEVRIIGTVLLLPDYELEDVSSFDTALGSVDLLPTGKVTVAEFPIEVNLVIGHPIHEQLITDCRAGTLRNFKLIEPGAAANETTFGGYIKSGGGSMAPRAGLKFTFTIAPSGVGTRA